MASELNFTGERFLPECAGEIAYEHWHRYAFARSLAKGARVLDVACGEGYGSALLARVAESVCGVDIAVQAVAHATAQYAARERLRFIVASCDRLPFDDASFDLIVSFETIEHIDAASQQRMLAEFARLLAPGGRLVLSSPNKALYSDATGYRNEFHVHELYGPELHSLLQAHFPVQRWYAQKLQLFSTLWDQTPVRRNYELQVLEGNEILAGAPPDALYFLVIASRETAATDQALPELSLFVDAGEAVLRRLVATEGEALRLDALLVARDQTLADTNARCRQLEDLVARRDQLIAERDAQISAASAHVNHLEILVAERERIVEKRDRQLTELNMAIADAQATHAEAVSAWQAAEMEYRERESRLAGQLETRARQIEELDRQVRERDLGLAYRQSFRWWLRLPLVRLKLAWKGKQGA